MTLSEKVKKVDQALPGHFLTAALVAVGIAFILIGLFVPSNIVKATMLVYAIVP